MPKTRLIVTVDKDILSKFKDICKSKDIKISTKINTLIREWIEKEER